jgi:OHCU decarboxylase
VSVTVQELNALRAGEAAALFTSCCGARRWVSAMVARRPFGTEADVLAAADEEWSRLGPSDWHEAFSHHPRIGERRSATPQDATAASWSAREQASVATANASVQDHLAEVNRRYEERFGHIYIVCASGKTADELLATARARLSNDPDAELRIAAEEQRKITALRLRTLFSENS